MLVVPVVDRHQSRARSRAAGPADASPVHGVDGGAFTRRIQPNTAVAEHLHPTALRMLAARGRSSAHSRVFFAPDGRCCGRTAVG